MRYNFLLLIICTAYSFSSEVIVSKDSVNVGKNYSSTIADRLFVINLTKDSIALDSAYVILDIIDTSGMGNYMIKNSQIEIYWMEYKNKSDFGWYLNEISKNKYKLYKNYFYPNDAIPVMCPPEDSCDLTRLQIGIYLESAHYPVYPNYLHGTILLYFNNNQTASINIYSDDLRTSIIKIKNNVIINRNEFTEGYFSLNGKKITNINHNSNKLFIVKSIKNRLTNKALNLDCELLRNDRGSEETNYGNSIGTNRLQFPAN